MNYLINISKRFISGNVSEFKICSTSCNCPVQSLCCNSKLPHGTRSVLYSLNTETTRPRTHTRSLLPVQQQLLSTTPPKHLRYTQQCMCHCNSFYTYTCSKAYVSKFKL